MLSEEQKSAWKEIQKALEPSFGGDLDLQAILFIIGIQELGHGYRKYSKQQKMEVMHVAICSILAPYGYYIYKGLDEDNWPHWEQGMPIPHMKAGEQERMMTEAVIRYFKEKEVIK